MQTSGRKKVVAWHGSIVLFSYSAGVLTDLAVIDRVGTSRWLVDQCTIGW